MCAGKCKEQSSLVSTNIQYWTQDYIQKQKAIAGRSKVPGENEMKIKCPWFGEVEEENIDESNRTHICREYFKTERELYLHIISYPHHNIAKKFARQTFKIHEKIEELDKSIKFNNEAKYYNPVINDRFEQVKQELKSLLENDDKK